MIQRIQSTIESEPNLSRRALSRRICEWLEWKRANGRLKDMSCRVALGKLESMGKLALPAPRTYFSKRRSKHPPLFRRGNTLQCDLSLVRPVELVRVGRGGSRTSRLWKELMERYHPQQAGPLCGAQSRYLIQGKGGIYLGGLAFSAAAWQVASRDEWIGWSPAARRRNLEKVICNSRFLILPWIHIPSLASHVLSLCRKRVIEDWYRQYGVEPLLMETFVEKERHRGTCYRAANWSHVGTTQGRSRQDRDRRLSTGIKDVYLYPLHHRARTLLREEPPHPVLDRRAGSLDWAEEELGLASFTDERLRGRLLVLARDLYERPQANIPQACQSRSKTKAAYRFFDHVDTTMEKILASHYEATLSRISDEKVVLAAQDTTSLNYSAHPATADLGPITNNVDGAIGLEMHDTMAFTVEGTPLGLVDVQCWARNPKNFGQKHRRYDRPIEQKESHKWLVSFRKTCEAQKRCPQTMLVSVGDREADIYELFQLALSDSTGPKLLVRAEQNRLLAEDGGHLRERMSQCPVGGVQVIKVPRQGARAAREAQLEIRFGPVMLKPPQRKPGLGELSLWAVLAEEREAPAGVEPLRWMLLTTLAVDTFEQAVEKLHWYTKRWGIEIYHRTLKSGCKIENRRLGTADRIESCLAIDLVVAWRIFHLTKLGRETPNVPCTVYFEEAEWKTLYSIVHQNPTLPSTPPTLREAIHMVASLGGFLGRKGDGEPGTQTVWRGLQRLDDMTQAWTFMAEKFAPHLLTPPVSSNPGYG